MSQLFLIALATLASEDLACIAAGVMVAQGRVDFIPAAFACFAGIFSGDALLYVVGRFGSSLSARLVSLERLRRASEWLHERGLIVVLLSRFTPGLRLPTYLAAGFLRMQFRQFAGYLALAGAAWTPILVGLAVIFGDGLLRATSVPAALILIFLGLRVTRTLTNFEERRRLVGFLKRKVQWEFWPAWITYLPLLPYLLYLSIRHRSLTVFTAANPGIASGGLTGESKFDILMHLSAAEGAVPAFTMIRATLDLEDRIAQASQWDKPFVLKPNVGERGKDVAIIRSHTELRRYFESHSGDTIIQEYVPGHEVGIFYIRYPWATHGQIVSITEKVSPRLIGDGQSTLAHLILRDRRAVCLANAYLQANRDSAGDVPVAGEVIQLVEIGSHCRGSIFLDGSQLNTRELEAEIDRIAKAHSGFFLGRFDIRTPSLEALKAGHSFKVIELNGVAAEPTHIYDPAITLVAAYRALFAQWRAAFEIGAWNRRHGGEPLSVTDLFRLITKHSERCAEDRNLAPV